MFSGEVVSIQLFGIPIASYTLTDLAVKCFNDIVSAKKKLSAIFLVNNIIIAILIAAKRRFKMFESKLFFSWEKTQGRERKNPKLKTRMKFMVIYLWFGFTNL